MKIRKGRISDLATLQQLFVDSVRNSCKEDYDPNQITAWVSSVENQQRWHGIFANQVVFVALVDDVICGFSTLADQHYLDMIYVHHSYQGRGVASLLYERIGRTVVSFGKREIIADVSITAKPFFIRQGFSVLKEQYVEVKGVRMINYKMRKVLVEKGNE